MDFEPKFTKFGTELPQLPKNPYEHKYLKQIFYKWGKKSKKPVGGVFLSQDWSKKNSRQKNCFLATLVIPVTRESNGICGGVGLI